MNILLAEPNVIIARGMQSLLTELFPDARISHTQIASDFIVALSVKSYEIIIIEPSIFEPPYQHFFSHLDKNIPVVIHSNLPHEVYALKFLGLGAMAYLQKQSSEEEIRSALSSVLKGRRYVNDEIRGQLFRMSQSVK